MQGRVKNYSQSFRLHLKQHLLSIYHVPFTYSGQLDTLSHIFFSAVLENRNYYAHFTDDIS